MPYKDKGEAIKAIDDFLHNPDRNATDLQLLVKAVTLLGNLKEWIHSSDDS